MVAPAKPQLPRQLRGFLDSASREPPNNVEHLAIYRTGQVPKLGRAMFVRNAVKPQQFPYPLPAGQLQN
jgi:hypothetical protein